jgi:hypothetical protein
VTLGAYSCEVNAMSIKNIEIIKTIYVSWRTLSSITVLKTTKAHFIVPLVPLTDINPDFELSPDAILRVLMAAISPPRSTEVF